MISLGKFVIRWLRQLGFGRSAVANDPVPRPEKPFYIAPETCQIKDINSVYLKLFGRKSHGTFVEIGAFDGETHSNTSFLADLGWRGYYVEPIKGLADKCSIRHANNDVVVVNSAVGESAGASKISLADSISSMYQHHIDAFNAASWGKGLHNEMYEDVSVITPTMLRSQIREDAIDLVVIDCEGGEWPIVNAMDLANWNVRVFIIESRDIDPDFPDEIRSESLRVNEKLQRFGYEIFWRDSINIIFRRL